MARKSKALRWVDFMTFIQWDNTNNWRVVNEHMQDEAIPKAKEWVAANIGFIQSEEAKIAFKQYFFSEKTGTVNAYYWKDRAAEALAALYAKGQTCDC